jgi:hypothetical protein
LDLRGSDQTDHHSVKQGRFLEIKNIFKWLSGEQFFETIF